MYQSTARSREALLVDIEEGVVLQAPPEASCSTRYVDSHPFIERSATHVYAGPDAARAARSLSLEGADYVLYEIVGNEAGGLYLKREV